MVKCLTECSLASTGIVAVDMLIMEGKSVHLIVIKSTREEVSGEINSSYHLPFQLEKKGKRTNKRQKACIPFILAAFNL